VLRRLRSVLAAFRGALDRESTEALRSQLGDVARVAGVARDAQVLRDRLPGSAARAPEGYVDTATLERLGAAIDERRSDATAALRDVLRSPGWFGALDALDHVIGTSPVGDHAGDDASAFTTRRIERERTRVRSALEGDIEDLGALHEVRKAARRLRYALEAAGDLPDVGKRRLGRLARVQDTLGDALDAANAAAAYRESARVAARSGVDTFGHGALATAERGVVEERIADGRRLLGKL
jgi:CHAD domain-containing protein